MHPESTAMACDKLSPRPSPQHSKSLTAPLDCTNCSKQQSNPINNFISKWKYKEDLAKPLNMKRTRPRKQPQTTYHFPLSHCSVNTFNPNNKQNENEVTTPPTPESSSPSDSPREISSRDSSPRDRSPRNSLSPRSNLSPRSSPRQLSRETLLKQHRAHLQQSSQEQKRQDDRDEHSSYDYHMIPISSQRQLENAQQEQSYHDYHMTSPKRHRRATTHLPPSPDSPANTIEISSICNPAYDHPSSPHSSDDNDDNYPSYPSPFTGNCVVRDSKKRRPSEEGMECETIEISDSESDYMTHSASHYRNACSFQSRRSAVLDTPLDGSDISLRPLSLTSAHNDLAKYHLEAPKSSPALPPLNLARLPSIKEFCPMDDCNPRLYQEAVRHHPRSQSFPCHY